MKKQITSSLLATAMVAGASAQTFVYESFNMDTGNLAGQSSTNSTGLSTAWSIDGADANNQLVSGSLSFGDLSTSGNSLSTTASNGSEDGQVTIDATISNAGKLADGQSLWFSLLIDGGVTSNSHSGFAFGTDGVAGAFNGVSMNNSGNGLGVYYQGSTFRATSWVNGARTGNGATFADGGVMLLVGEITWSAAAETLNLYQPSMTDLSNGVTGAVVSTLTTASNLDQSAFDTISYTSRGSAGGDLFDEIRFGASYADVSPLAAVPEPGSFALLAGSLALTSIMLRRRRS